MKPLLSFFFVLLVIPFIANCQDGYAITPMSFNESYNVDLSSVEILRFAANMENNSDSTMMINWEVINIDLPEEWGLGISDKDISYVPGPPYITSNFNPLSFEPGEKEIPYNIDFYLRDTPGCGSFQVLIRLADSETIIDTIEYEIRVNNDDCLLSNFDDEYLNSDVDIFPNPFSSELGIKSTVSIWNVNIYDLLGNKLGSQFSSFQRLNISDLRPGTYFVEIITIDGRRTIKKVTKQ